MIGLVASTAAGAQTPQTAPKQADPKQSDSLSLYFGSGRATIDGQGQAVLDQAARTYREGQPIIMVVSGGTDATGSAAENLRLSQLRADNVVRGLVTRGIPVDHFQILAKGQTEPAVAGAGRDADPRNRRVEITWR